MSTSAFVNQSIPAYVANGQRFQADHNYPANVWYASGVNMSGTSQTLTAWALCGAVLR